MVRLTSWLRLASERRRTRRATAVAVRTNRSRGTHCFYCDVPFEPEGNLARTIDHRHPRRLGGTDGMRNLVFACHACNQRKAAIPEQEFTESSWLRQRRADVGAGRIDLLG